MLCLQGTLGIDERHACDKITHSPLKGFLVPFTNSYLLLNKQLSGDVRTSYNRFINVLRRKCAQYL